MEQIYEDGLARAIGVSNFLVHHLEDLIADSNLVPMVNQVEFHPRLRQPELMEYCREHQIQLEAWSPLLKGGLGKLPELEQIGARYGKTAAQIVLRWDLQHEVVTIPKSAHRQRIEENADIFDFELLAEDMAKIDALDKDERTGDHPDNVAF